MKFNQKFVLSTVVASFIIVSNAKVLPSASADNLGQSTNFLNHSFTKDRKTINHKKELDVLNLNLSLNFNFNLDNRKNYLCQINQRSISEDWVNLLGRLIIILSFGFIGSIGNSVVIERYIKLIFHNMLPIFLVVFISISFLSLASVIAATSTSVSSQNSCILK
ncbi:MAG: hypothetical protein KI793_21700 [Rivularia sp. (in: Bacteria)]|nr:hypothetical protein [Rivularia sp. MS3]